MNKFQMDGRSMPDRWERCSRDTTGKSAIQLSIHPTTPYKGVKK